MGIKEVIKTSLNSIIESVSEINQESERNVVFKHRENERTVEFDIAVIAEEEKGKAARIKIATIISGGMEESKNLKNSSISRINFRLDVEGETNKEKSARVIDKKNREDETKQNNFKNSPI
jgi:hypothetical protein